MANVGLKSFLHGALTDTAGAITYAAPTKLAGAIEIKEKLELNEASLPHDDIIDNQVSEFKSGTITLGVDNDDDTIFANLLGKKLESLQFTPTEGGTAVTVKQVTSGTNDMAIFVGFGYITAKYVDNVRKYKVQFYKKVQFKPFGSDAKTKGDKLEFTTPSVEGTILTLKDGTYEIHATLDTEELAIAYLKSLFVAA